jgi:hypothetical protein
VKMISRNPTTLKYQLDVFVAVGYPVIGYLYQCFCRFPKRSNP